MDSGIEVSGEWLLLTIGVVVVLGYKLIKKKPIEFKHVVVVYELFMMLVAIIMFGGWGLIVAYVIYQLFSIGTYILLAFGLVSKQIEGEHEGFIDNGEVVRVEHKITKYNNYMNCITITMLICLMLSDNFVMDSIVGFQL